jgi:hypothetical protein
MQRRDNSCHYLEQNPDPSDVQPVVTRCTDCAILALDVYDEVYSKQTNSVALSPRANYTD